MLLPLHLVVLALAGTAFAKSNQLTKRDDCKPVTVVSGDSCASLASKCSISAQDFNNFNTDPALCSTLAPGQRVCCSKGTLPDIKPKPKDDGGCATYTVKKGDTCSAIAGANGLQVGDLSTFNDKTTWGWSGCDNLGVDMSICISTGNPPMPQSLDNAVCGPLKPGSQPPANGNLSQVNPCPLNACCTIWGQCGITAEFCTEEDGPTGNPGTAPSGHNGCISNCGTLIDDNENPPDSFLQIGYYEAWNFNRPCNTMRVDSISSNYTHLHWAFATVTPEYDVSMNDSYNQWTSFINFQTARRIVSIGGWGFSTDPTTYDILRQAVQPANVQTFVDNIAAFVKRTTAVGIDIDWEYPGATDIPGIPSGDPSDPANYLQFLKLLRSTLSNDVSISIAAPASYWYLQAFPIAEMAEVVNYTVFMTYDLHGQWDYGNKWSQDGCPGGDCLRSHVNFTETRLALAMITKAGVPSNKTAVGVSSYGRSFTMAQAGCTDPMCTYEGPNSTATPGECTSVAGIISNAEIEALLIDEDNVTKSWYDMDSNTNMLVYNDNQWVSYMDDVTKADRANMYKNLNFHGTADWAVDLAYDLDDGEEPDDEYDDIDDDGPAPPYVPCDAHYATLEDLEAANDSIPQDCKTMYTLDTLSSVLDAAIGDYTNLMANDYDAKLKTYAQAVAQQAPDSVHTFITHNSSEYFSCVVSELTACCSSCESILPDGWTNKCANCFNDAPCTKRVAARDAPTTHVQDIPPQHSAINFIVVNKTEPCPPDYSQRGLSGQPLDDQTVYWTLLPDTADQFWSALSQGTGISRDNTTIESYNRGNECVGVTHDDDMCWATGMGYGIPVVTSYTADDVANPKEIVQSALEKSVDLQTQIRTALAELRTWTYYGDEGELIDSISVPVLMIADAVASMQTVEDTAEEIDAEKRKNIIISVISALLFFLPIAGEVAGSVAALANVARIIAMISIVGDIAFSAYSIADDPSDPAMGILGLVLAPLALGDVVRISKAANLRRGMTDDDMVKLGGKIAPRMKTIQKLVGKCGKR